MPDRPDSVSRHAITASCLFHAAHSAAVSSTRASVYRLTVRDDHARERQCEVQVTTSCQSASGFQPGCAMRQIHRPGARSMICMARTSYSRAVRPSEQLLRALQGASADELTAWLSPQALLAAMLGDTAILAAMLESLRTGGSAVVAALPEAAALAAPMAPQVEHEVGTDRPLLDHVATRLLDRRLRGLETRDLARFQDRGLTPGAFAALADRCARVTAAGLGPALRVAIVHLDIAKTSDPALRARWAGIPLEVHNEAAAAILRRADRARAWPLPDALGKLAIAWVEAHGLAGQHVRGEGPLVMFAPLVGALRELAPALGRVLELPPGDAVALALDALHVLDACDTGAVREGLLDDALLARLAGVRERLGAACAPPAWHDPERALRASEPAPDRAWLAVRLRALRPDPAGVDEAVARLADDELAVLGPALATCQLWYCEAATGALSPHAQLRVLAAAVGAARAHDVDTERPWHAQLRPLVARLHGDAAPARYRRRLVEAMLTDVPVAAMLAHAANTGPLGMVTGQLAHPTDRDAIVVDYRDTEESAALVTLLGIYETRSAVAYHTMLKSLCELYALRKDEFDRVANEANYLATMNAARSDKERMLDFVVPGRIVEIGPGGGVVLDLLAQRFPDAEVIGIDLSSEVVATLRTRAREGGRRWRVIEGAAEDLATLVPGPIDSVVFCSVLHEVYSYTPPRFSLDSVKRVVQAAFAALRPGGRLVIRDGVAPPPGTRRLRMLAPDVRPMLELYRQQFEGRAIRYRELAPDRVELSTADAMEFLYTYTWGPASFPYEVREQYGILTYEDYLTTLLAWCPGARVVDNPLRSYLQPGYRDHLAGKVELTDERDQPVALPDSNCLLVIERR
jgi:SAM-dependent methyltransferase